MESLVLRANIFNNSTIVVYGKFPGWNYRHHLKDAEDYPMAMFKLSGLIRNHSEQLSESQAVTVEGTGLQTVGRCWLEKSGQSILPESLGTLAPTKKEGWVLSRHAVPSSGSFSVNSSAAAVNLQMMADPRRGAPTGRQSLLKSCASSLPKARDQTSLKVPEVLVERGSSKTQGSNFFFPHFENLENI